MKATQAQAPSLATWTVSLLLSALTLSCGGDEPTDEPAAGAAAPPKPTVVIARIESRTVPILRDFVARTEAKETIAIQARVEAVLMAREFEEGRRVEKGQVLYRLDDRSYRASLAAAEAQLAKAQADRKLAEEQVSVRAAEASLAQAGAKLVKAEQDVARLEPLAEKDAVPRQDLDTAVAAREVAKADVDVQTATLENARIQEAVGLLLTEAEVTSAEASVDLAQLNLEYCTITSPIDGLIGRTEFNVGNLVGRGEATILATVSSIDPMYVTFAISEAEYLQTNTRRQERGLDEEPVLAQLVLADDSIHPHVGRILTADRAVAIETGTLQLVAEFPDPEALLRPGQFGRIRISVLELENAILVPQRAIIEQQSTKAVLVVGDGDKVSLRSLQLTERFEEFYVVTDGLRAGDRVIVEGQLKVRPGMAVRPMDRPASQEPTEQGE